MRSLEAALSVDLPALNQRSFQGTRKYACIPAHDISRILNPIAPLKINCHGVCALLCPVSRAGKCVVKVLQGYASSPVQIFTT